MYGDRLPVNLRTARKSLGITYIYVLNVNQQPPPHRCISTVVSTVTVPAILKTNLNNRHISSVMHGCTYLIIVNYYLECIIACAKVIHHQSSMKYLYSNIGQVIKDFSLCPGEKLNLQQ